MRGTAVAGGRGGLGRGGGAGLREEQRQGEAGAQHRGEGTPGRNGQIATPLGGGGHPVVLTPVGFRAVSFSCYGRV